MEVVPDARREARDASWDVVKAARVSCDVHRCALAAEAAKECGVCPGLAQTNPVDDELVSGLRQKNGRRTGGRHKVAYIEDGARAPPRGSRIHHVPLSGRPSCRAGAAIGAVGAADTICILEAGATIVAIAVGGPAAMLAAASKNGVVGDVDRVAGKEMIEEHDPNLIGVYGLVVDDSALARIELRLHRRERRRRRRRRV